MGVMPFTLIQGSGEVPSTRTTLSNAEMMWHVLEEMVLPITRLVHAKWVTKALFAPIALKTTPGLVHPTNAVCVQTLKETF